MIIQTKWNSYILQLSHFGQCLTASIRLNNTPCGPTILFPGVCNIMNAVNESNKCMSTVCKKPQIMEISSDISLLTQNITELPTENGKYIYHCIYIDIQN